MGLVNQRLWGSIFTVAKNIYWEVIDFVNPRYPATVLTNAAPRDSDGTGAKLVDTLD